MSKKLIAFIIFIFLLTLAFSCSLLNIWMYSYNDDHIFIDEGPEYKRPYNLPNRTDEWVTKNGDWTVGSGEIVENSIILLNGNLNIVGNIFWGSTATIFNNVTVIINSTSSTDGPYGWDCYWFSVGNHLYLNNSIITAFDANYHYYFTTGHVGADISINNSVISYAKDISMDGNNVTITNSTFKNNWRLVIAKSIYSAKRDVRFCLFQNNIDGIWLEEGAIADIRFNIFKNNTYNAVCGVVGYNKLEYNYWNANNKFEIQSLICDETADFEPWLEEPPF